MKEPGKVQFINSCCKMSYDRIAHTSNIFFPFFSHSPFLSRSFLILFMTCVSVWFFSFFKFYYSPYSIHSPTPSRFRNGSEGLRKVMIDLKCQILFIVNRCVSIKWTILHGETQGKITLSRQEATFSHILCIDIRFYRTPAIFL